MSQETVTRCDDCKNIMPVDESEVNMHMKTTALYGHVELSLRILFDNDTTVNDLCPSCRIKAMQVVHRQIGERLEQMAEGMSDG